MKAYEVPAKVTSDGKLELPTTLPWLPPEQTIKVILLVPEQTDLDENLIWNRFVANQFLAGYNEADAIYDQI